MRVLVVEDDTLTAMHLAELVSGSGHCPCATASTVGHAISLAAIHNPEVALMDLWLALGESGIDAARELYQRHGLRCIFVTATFDERTMSALLPFEPIDFVLKPVIPRYLRMALEKAKRLLAGDRDLPPSPDAT